MQGERQCKDCIENIQLLAKKNWFASAPLLPLASSGGESHVTHIPLCLYWLQTYRHTHPCCSLLLAGYRRHLFRLLVTAILLFKSLPTAHDNSWASVHRRTGKLKALTSSSHFTTAVQSTVDAAPNLPSLSCATFLSIVNKPDLVQGTALAIIKYIIIQYPLETYLTLCQVYRHSSHFGYTGSG